jgi:TolB-like protein/Flp pilus assembly protein TadD
LIEFETLVVWLHPVRPSSGFSWSCAGGAYFAPRRTTSSAPGWCCRSPTWCFLRWGCPSCRFYDVSTDGIHRTQPAGAGELDSAPPLRRTDYLLLTALAAVAAGILYNTAGKVVDEPADQYSAAAPGDGPPMVAVLPFTTTSREGDSEFFATGVHDDLLTQLSQLQSLRVISRTSVLEFKDVARNIREIGRTLGADAILEGGVQSAGERIRINAQLIDARTDEHLWAQTYDRELTPASIFDVQSEIARAITASLHTTLSHQDKVQLDAIPTENMAAYRAFRRAQEIRYTQTVWKNKDYRQALEKAIELDPTFTRAMADLVGHLSFTNFFHPEDLSQIPLAEEMLERIRTEAPHSADYLLAQSFYTYYTLKEFDRALEFIKQAEDMRPSDMRILELKVYILRRLGLFKERAEVYRKLRKLDPRSPGHIAGLAFTLVLDHQYDEVRAVLESSPRENHALASMYAFIQLREHRDFDRWIAEQDEIDREFGDQVNPMHTWEMHIAKRDFEGAEQVISQLRDNDSDIGVYLSDQNMARISTWWFLGRDDELAGFLPEKRAFLDQSRDDDGNFVNFGTYQIVALIAAAEGNQEEAVRLARRVLREAAGDMTALSGMRGESCKIMAMAGAAAEAVECLREAFTEPSVVSYFLEPHFPYYDPIRETPEFQALLAEFE